MKGKKRRKGKEKGTCSRASTDNLALILMRVISFGVPEDDLYVFQPLKRISIVELLSWLHYNKTWLHETGLIYLLWGEEEKVGRYRCYSGHKRCNKTWRLPRERLPCKIFVHRSIIKTKNEARKCFRSSFQRDCWGSKVPEARPLSRNCQILFQRNVARSSLSTLRF